MPRPVSGSVLACDSSSRERVAHELLDGVGLDRAGGVRQPLDRVGEPLGLLLGQLVAQGAHEHGLERGDVARHVGGARLAAAAQPRQRGGPLGLLLAQLVGVAVGARDRIRRCR